jgi:hypothetical protein
MNRTAAAHRAGSVQQVCHLLNSFIIKIPRPGKPGKCFTGEGMVSAINGRNEVDFFGGNIAGVFIDLVINATFGTKSAMNTAIEVGQQLAAAIGFKDFQPFFLLIFSQFSQTFQIYVIRFIFTKYSPTVF